MANISVGNFDEVKKHLRDELKILSDRLDKSVKSINGADDPNRLNSIRDLLGLVKLVAETIEKVSFSPTINFNVPDVIVPEIKIPDIYVPEIKVPKSDAPIVNVPAPIVNVEAPIIDLTELTLLLTPIKILIDNFGELSKSIGNMPANQEILLENLAKESNRNLSNMSAVFSGSSGMSSDEYFATTKRLYRSSTANNTFATVGVVSSLILASNGSRISATFTNDSDATIYLSKDFATGTAIGLLNRSVMASYSIKRAGSLSYSQFP